MKKLASGNHLRMEGRGQTSKWSAINTSERGRERILSQKKELEQELLMRFH